MPLAEETRGAESAGDTVVAANQVSNEPVHPHSPQSSCHQSLVSFPSPTCGSINPVTPRVGHTTLKMPRGHAQPAGRLRRVPYKWRTRTGFHHSLPSTLPSSSFSDDHHYLRPKSKPRPAAGDTDQAMAAPEPPPPSGTGFFGMLSFRRSATAVASFDPAQDDELLALDALQAHVADRLQALSAHASSPSTLSLPFLAKLLDAVLSSDAAFRAVLAVGPVAAALSRPPADRLATDLLDRAVKTLDVLNAASLALASLRASHRAALAAASCLLAPALHRAHLARARRAIARLFPDDARSGGIGGGGSAPSPSSRTMRALSFSVSKNWSAGRHMNAMAAHLAPPPLQAPATAAGAGCGLGLALYTMSSVLVFAMWALVAAVPCQDRGSAAAPVAPPKQAQWAAPMSALQDRIADEWRRREKRQGSSSGPATPTAGLLAEMQAAERAARELNSLLEEIAEEQEDEEHVGIVSEERAREVTERAEELAAACRALEDGLAPMERQVRAVFHRVVACRAEVVRCIDHSSRAATAANAPPSASGVPPQHQHSF